jgi:hypothetical protein
MPIYPFDNRPLSVVNRYGKRFSFRPKGPITFYGKRKNPFSAAKLDVSPNYAARMFVGLSVGLVDTHSVDTVIRETRTFLKGKKYAEDSSFITQRGICTVGEGEGAKVVPENSVQVVIFKDPKAKEVWFRRIVRGLALHLRRSLSQEYVILDYQKNGLSEYIWYVT